jgi:hypothetical protein
MAHDNPALLRHAVCMPSKAPSTLSPTAISPSASKAGVQRSRQLADQWACLIARIINDLRALGSTSHEQLAVELNARGIPTLRSGTWHRTTVQNLLHRYAHVRRSNPQLVASTLLNPPPQLLRHIAEHQLNELDSQRALRDPP